MESGSELLLHPSRGKAFLLTATCAIAAIVFALVVSARGLFGLLEWLGALSCGRSLPAANASRMRERHRWCWCTDITCLQRGTGTPMATGVPVALLRRELELPYAVGRAT